MIDFLHIFIQSWGSMVEMHRGEQEQKSRQMHGGDIKARDAVGVKKA
jgi:hypothetical protein